MKRRAWAVWSLGAMLALTAVAVLVLEVAAPHYRPPLRLGEVYGVDVSAHQGPIDWRAVAHDSIDTAYLKATEGATFRDPRFVTNWREAREAGLTVGAYHFFTLCRSGADQASNLLDALDEVGGIGDPSMLPVVVDLEFGGNCSARPPRREVQGEVDAFIDLIEEATGRPVVYYILGPWSDRYPPTRERERWVRSLGLRSAGDWTWWQVSNRAAVDGIDGPVDLDVARAAD